MRNVPKLVAATIAILAAPSAAWAANLSSDDGKGTQTVLTHGDQSFSSTGKLKSTSGNDVYLRGIVIFNNYPDYTCNRISPNTDSATYKTRGGSCSQVLSIPPSADAAGWKICRDRPFVPDGCGPQARESF